MLLIFGKVTVSALSVTFRLHDSAYSKNACQKLFQSIAQVHSPRAWTQYPMLRNLQWEVKRGYF